MNSYFDTNLLKPLDLQKIEQGLRDLRGKYGPIITLRIGHRPAIFVSSHSIAHHALIQNGAHFSDRPKALATVEIFSSNQHTISSAAYGPTWRLLRRNLTSEILHPSRVKSYTHARQWVLGILIHRLLNSAEDSSAEAVKVVHHFQYAMFCFWNELLRMRQDQEEVLIPLIEARVDVLKQRRQGNQEEESSVVAYVDTLVDLELPDEKRKLNNDEMRGRGRGSDGGVQYNREQGDQDNAIWGREEDLSSKWFGSASLGIFCRQFGLVF
ncbi:hypothetical protein ACSBR2_038583 [Camellia fascicularis]